MCLKQLPSTLNQMDGVARSTKHGSRLKNEAIVILQCSLGKTVRLLQFQHQAMLSSEVNFLTKLP